MGKLKKYLYVVISLMIVNIVCFGTLITLYNKDVNFNLAIIPETDEHIHIFYSETEEFIDAQSQPFDLKKDLTNVVNIDINPTTKFIRIMFSNEIDNKNVIQNISLMKLTSSLNLHEQISDKLNVINGSYVNRSKERLDYIGNAGDSSITMQIDPSITNDFLLRNKGLFQKLSVLICSVVDVILVIFLMIARKQSLIKYLLKNKKPMLRLFFDKLKNRCNLADFDNLMEIGCCFSLMFLTWFIMKIAFKVDNINGIVSSMWVCLTVIPIMFTLSCIKRNEIVLISGINTHKNILKVKIELLLNIISSGFFYFIFLTVLILLSKIFGATVGIFSLQYILYFIVLCAFVYTLSFFIFVIYYKFQRYRKFFKYLICLICLIPLIPMLMIPNPYIQLLLQLNPLYYISNGFIDCVSTNVLIVSKISESLNFILITIGLYVLGTHYYHVIEDTKEAFVYRSRSNANTVKLFLQKKAKPKTLMILIATIIYFGYCIIVIFSLPEKFINTRTIGVHSDKPLGELAQGNVYQQTFIATENELAGIGVRMGLYGATQHNEVTIKVGDNSTVIKEQTFDIYGMSDNEYYQIGFEPQKNSLDKEYTITISSNASLENKVTLWTSEKDTYKNGALSYNGKLQDKDLDVQQIFGTKSTKTFILSAITILFCIIMIVILSCYTNGKRKNTMIFSIYLIALFYNAFQGVYYASYVQKFPDEKAQVAYIAYMDQNPEVIPNFKDIKIHSKCSSYATKVDCDIDEESTNYLGHPPLYYYMMSRLDAVHIENGKITGDLKPLRIANLFISTIGLSIIFFIGYKYIKSRTIYHALFAIACISIPMFSYLSCAINNDNLAFLGVAVFLLGAMKYTEKDGYAAHILISIGITVTVLSKVTAGTMLLLGAGLFIGYKMIKERSFKPLIRKEFMITIPIYAIALIYFSGLYMEFHTFQPSLFKLNYEYYKTTEFYTPREEWKTLDFFEYAQYYWRNFIKTWQSIASHITLYKRFSFVSLECVATTSILLSPLILLFYFPKTKKDNKLILLKSMLIAIYATMGIQFIRAYINFKNTTGYLGSYQSRYYLCVLPILVFSLIYIIDKIENKYVKKFDIKKKIYIKVLINIIILGLICLLFYEDFLYFLLNFRNYFSFLR